MHTPASPADEARAEAPLVILWTQDDVHRWLKSGYGQSPDRIEGVERI
jgi:hypothetical protein